MLRHGHSALALALCLAACSRPERPAPAPSSSGALPSPAAPSSPAVDLAPLLEDAVRAFRREHGGGGPPSLRTFPARPLPWDGGGSTAVPVWIDGEFCKLAVVDTKRRAATILFEPDLRPCKGLEVRSADVNGDGAPDFGLLIRVPSNRHAVDVDEGVVYLSDAKSPHLCFAPRLGPLLLGPVEGPPDDAFLGAVQREVARAGPAVLSCQRGP